jgi:hypothetical protein
MVEKSSKLLKPKQFPRRDPPRWRGRFATCAI